jgi:hypothetical protein
MRWSGEVARFSRLREGGPGRAGPLIGVGLGLTGLLVLGMAQTGQGIDGPGPATVLVAVLGLGTLALWVAIKAGLRDRRVVFVIGPEGVRIRPSRAQARLDRRLGGLMRLVFLLTWKSGQWAAWAPTLRWRGIRAAEFLPERGEILLRGAPWDIRLVCPPERYQEIAARVWERLPAPARPEPAPA